jgi:hypothetical protein
MYLYHFSFTRLKDATHEKLFLFLDRLIAFPPSPPPPTPAIPYLLQKIVISLNNMLKIKVYVGISHLGGDVVSS